MKSLPCLGPGCAARRIHHERQDEPLGTRMVSVADEATVFDPVFCSTTCAILGGWYVLTYETPEQEKRRQGEWRRRRQQ